MKRFLLSAFTAVAFLCATAETVILDFNENQYGQTVYSESTGYFEDGYTFSTGVISITTNNLSGSGVRFWQATSGQISLRVMKKSGITFSCPHGIITELTIDSTQKNSFTGSGYANGTFSGESETIELVNSGSNTAVINSITVTYSIDEASVEIPVNYGIIENGTYYIATTRPTGFGIFLSQTSGSLTRTVEADDNCRWIVTSNPDGSYYIKNYANGYYLSGDQLSTTPEKLYLFHNTTAGANGIGICTENNRNSNCFLNVSTHSNDLTTYSNDDGSCWIFASSLDNSSLPQIVNDIIYTPVSETECMVSGYTSVPLEFTIPTTVSFNGRNYIVKNVGPAAFSTCSTLEKITIPEGMTFIDYCSFEQCSALTQVNLPSSINRIGHSAFYRCYNIEDVTCLATTPPVLYINSNVASKLVFSSEALSNAILRVPESSVNQYKSASIWSSFKVIISADKITGKEPQDAELRFDKESVTAYIGQPFSAPVLTKETTVAVTYSSNNSNVATVDAATGEVTLEGAGTAIITARAEANKDFLAGSASYTLIVIEPQNAGLRFDKESVTAYLGQSFSTPVLTKDTTAAVTYSSNNSNVATVDAATGEVTLLGIGTAIITARAEANKDFLAGSASYTLNVRNISGVEFTYTYEGKTLTYTILDDKTCATKKGANYEPGNVVSGDLIIPEKAYYMGEAYSVVEISADSFINCPYLTSVSIPNSVTSIGRGAFYGCTGLTSIEIPNSVTEIDYDAFKNCSGLTSITIGSSVETIGIGYTGTLFGGCSSLTNFIVEENNPAYTSIDGVLFSKDKSCLVAFPAGSKIDHYDIPNSVTSIGVGAFYSCSGLTEVTIGNSVTKIGNSAFYSCSGLTEVIIPDSVTEIGRSAFEGCSGLTEVTIGNSVTSIGNYAFNGCIALINLIIEDGESSLSLGYNIYDSSADGKGLFYDCPLETIYLGRNLYFDYYNHSGFSPFYNITTLKEVVVGSSVTKLHFSTFYDCSGLNSVTLPNSLQTIDNQVFRNCSKLTEVIIPNSVTSIGAKAFYGCSGLTEIIIPKSVKTIGEQAFYDCSGLKKSAYPHTLMNPFRNGIAVMYNCYLETEYTDGCIYTLGKTFLIFVSTTFEGEYIIPETVTEIGGYAFAGCSGLTSVTIPKSVTSIGDDAFSGCIGLTEVNIPNSVTKISDGAFYYCSGLTEVEIPNSVTEIGVQAFEGCSGLTEVNIPNSVTEISDGAFNSCNNIKSLIFEDGDKELTLGCAEYSYDQNGKGLFYDCPLETIYLGRNLNFDYYNRSGFSPFYNITTLKEVIVGSSVTKLHFSTFYNCLGLNSVTLPNSLQTIDNQVFRNCRKLTEVIIPNSVTSIGDNAFYGCSGLLSIIIPISVSSVGKKAFSGCDNLVKSAYPNSFSENPFPSGVAIKYPAKTSVMVDGVIYNTRQYILYFVPVNLTEFTVLETVKYIEDNAFYGCDYMNTLKIESSTPPSVTRESFDDEMYSQTTLLVPEGSESEYKTAPIWNLFYNIETYDPNAENPEVGIDNVEDSENEPVEVYNLGGVKVGESLEGLSNGIYIVRQGAKTTKVVI